jgi:hypothetical protein
MLSPDTKIQNMFNNMRAGQRDFLGSNRISDSERRKLIHVHNRPRIELELQLAGMGQFGLLKKSNARNGYSGAHNLHTQHHRFAH